MIDKELFDSFEVGAISLAKMRGKITRVYPAASGTGWYFSTLIESGSPLLEATPDGEVTLFGDWKDGQYFLKGFLICPVRGMSYPQEFFDNVTKLGEKFGVHIYFPSRDTNQNDPTGLQICKDNRKALEDAAIVFVLWNGKSQGVLFDLGMAFALRKRIMIIEVPEPTEGKSFQNMMRAWELEYGRS